MKQISMALIIMFFICAPGVAAFSQEIYAVSGGTKSEPDQKNKKKIRLIAENEKVRIVTGEYRDSKVRSALFVIYLKVENLSNEPLTIDPSTFNAVDDAGRGYAGLAPTEAIKRALDRSAGTRTVVGMVFAGPLAGPALQQAAERNVSEKVNRECLQPGNLPGHSFKEGAVFFEAPKQKHFTLKINFGDLWPESFTFGTEKTN